MQNDQYVHSLVLKWLKKKGYSEVSTKLSSSTISLYNLRCSRPDQTSKALVKEAGTIGSEPSQNLEKYVAGSEL
jgi:hypothetical protein